MTRQVERRRDYQRRAAAEIALALAEMNAGWGDHASALRHLYAADEICGGVLVGRFSRRPELTARRDEWVHRAMNEITA